MKLIIELNLDSALARALLQRAHARGLSREAAAVELMTTTLEATGELETPIAGPPPLRFTKPEGNA